MKNTNNLLYVHIHGVTDWGFISSILVQKQDLRTGDLPADKEDTDRPENRTK